MSPKASSDFGLYREKQKKKHLRSLKFVSVVGGIVVLLFVLLYALLYLVTNGSLVEASFESSIEKPSIKAEKYVLSRSVKREIFQNPQAKPFGLTYRGQPPSQFTSTTEKITTLNYPQLSRFRHRYYPRNIQDIISHSSNEFLKNPKKYKHSSSENVQQNKPFGYYSGNDPFFLYKPNDPGEINLLAPRHFRFAPPPWSNLKPHATRIFSNKQFEEKENRPKPLTLTLNIFPDNDGREKHKISNRNGNLQPKIMVPEGENNSKKMVIHVNLYPDRSPEGESKLYANVLTTPSIN